MVLAWHFIGQTLLSSSLPNAHYVSSVFILGRTGVDLFFVLSGFLIIGILIDQKRSPNLFFVFYIRRTSRIIPPYLLLLLIFWILTSAFELRDQNSDTIPFWSYFLFIQNWFMSFANDWGPSGISVTWSVAIEEQFYIVFPLILLITPAERLRSILIAIAVTSWLCRAGLTLVAPSAAFAPYVNTILRLDALCVGGLIATIYRDKPLFSRLLAERQRVLKATMALSTLVIPLLYGINTNIRPTMYIYGHAFLAIYFGAIVLLTLLYKGDARCKFLRGRVLLFFGLISYSAYLFHPIIIMGIFKYRDRLEQWSSWQDAIALALAFTSTLLVCWLFRFIENYFIGIGHGFKYKAQQEIA